MSTNENKNPQLVFSWKAPLRPFKKRAKSVLRFYLAVALLLSLIVFFFGDKILLIPIWSLLFLFYTLTITPPPEVENKITRFGIESAGITLRWESLSHFYFTSRFGFFVLTVVSHAPYFYHAYLVVTDAQTKNKLTGLLSEHLIFQENPQRGFNDKMVDFLSALIPDESPEEGRQATPQVVSAKPQPASL